MITLKLFYIIIYQHVIITVNIHLVNYDITMKNRLLRNKVYFTPNYELKSVQFFFCYYTSHFLCLIFYFSIISIL